ncbi:MAG: GGDEF domain-containing protein [Anaerolineales bacterium]|nr:MAG: GGDEF domain-containing protein [Anaerolineales bacterium]
MRNLWRSLYPKLEQLSTTGVYAIAFLLIVLIGWLDYSAGSEIAFSFLYLLPISFVTWYASLRGGYFVIAASLAVWLVTTRLTGEYYHSEWTRYFDLGSRLAVNLLIAFLLNELKLALQLEREMSRRDPLTGIFNSREFRAQLGQELQRADRLSYPISLMYIDLDNFKQVNDTHGHSAGDEQLKRIAQVIGGIIRKTDLFARLGGDEFALFLPNVDRVNVKCVVKKVEEAVSREMNALASPVTLSIGVVTFHSPPLSVDDLLNKADALMYQAKTAGKQHAMYFVVE